MIFNDLGSPSKFMSRGCKSTGGDLEKVLDIRKSRKISQVFTAVVTSSLHKLSPRKRCNFLELDDTAQISGKSSE